MRAPLRPLLLSGLLLLALAALPQLPAHADGPLVKVAGVETTADAAPRTTAHVTVADAHGVPVQGLQAGDFQVAVDGKPPSNLDVQPGQETGAGLTAALALDTSGSMAGRPLADLENAAAQFVNALAPDDQVALIDFGGSVRQDVPLTSDHNAVLAGIAALQAGGNTPLFDAVSTAVQTVAPGPVGRRAVVLMTDGGENESALKLDTIVNQATQAGVPVYVIGLGNDIDTQTLGLLAGDTGGSFQNAPASDALAQSFTQVAQQLRTEYEVSYDAPASNRDAQFNVQITVNANGASGTDGAQYIVKAVIPQHITVTLASPSDGQAANGDVQVQADVQPAVSAQNVRFLVNGNEIGAAQSPPFTAIWRPGNATSGDYVVRVEATGIDGQTSAVQATVHYTTPHVTVQLLSPRANATLDKTAQIQADISPAASASNVHFDIDGRTLASPSGPPWVATLDPRQQIHGKHTITVSATGVDGQTVTAQTTVFLTAPPGNTAVVVSLVVLALALAAVAFALLMGTRRRRGHSRAGPAVAAPPGGFGPGSAPGGVPPKNPPGWLVETAPDGSSRRWPLQAGETLIGRDVSQPHILLADQDVSRRHAAVRLDNGVLIFSDLGPTNPSTINGQPVVGERVLNDGDVIMVGGTRLEFVAAQPVGAGRR